MRMAVCCGALVVATALCARAQDTVDPRVRRALDGLRPPVAVRDQPILRWTLEARMAELHVPGVGIAIIDSGRVIWAGGFGVRETGNADPVTTSTLFQAQSISKAIAVTAMLALVDAGVLTLDTDVNTYLKSWKVPKNRFTDSASVTLRRIASHSAGITPASFPGYMPGSPLPTLVQILEGKSPANTPAVRVDTFPGAVEQYSGGGLLVLQQALIDATGEPFPVSSKRLVFDKLGMRSSTFEEPLSSAWAGRAAIGHDLNGAPYSGKMACLSGDGGGRAVEHTQRPRTMGNRHRRRVERRHEPRHFAKARARDVDRAEGISGTGRFSRRQRFLICLRAQRLDARLSCRRRDVSEHWQRSRGDDERGSGRSAHLRAHAKCRRGVPLARTSPDGARRSESAANGLRWSNGYVRRAATSRRDARGDHSLVRLGKVVFRVSAI